MFCVISPARRLVSTPLLLTLVTLALPTLALATVTENTANVSVGEDHSPAWQSELKAGLNLHQFSYAEDLKNHPGKSTESALIPELQAGYSLRPTEGAWQLRSLLGISTGTTQHDGTDMTGEKSFVFENPATILNFEVSVLQQFTEFDLSSAGQSSLSGYLGVGYHFWSRGDGRKVNEVSNYNEAYRWFYLPVGLVLNQPLSGSLSMALDASLRPTLGGKMTAKLTDIDTRIDDVTVNLGSELGWRVSLPVAFRMARQISLEVAPYLETSSIGASQPVPLTVGGKSTGRSILEPDSQTHQYGLATLARMSF